MNKFICLALLALSGDAIADSLGDYATASNVCGKFTTFQPSTGAAFALAGTPALSVYKDNSTTESTAGVTLTAGFDSRTGLNHYCIDTSADAIFYSAGSNFDVVVTAGTVDSVSVVGSVVGSFTLAKTSALRPAIAGRALAVSAGGAADANVTQYGGTNGTFTTGQPTVRLSAGTGTGQISLTSGAVTAGTVSDKTGYSLSSTQTFSVTGNITGNVSGSVGSVTGSVGSIASGGISEASFATTAGSFRPMGIARQGTAQSATGTTLVLDSAATFGDDTPIGMTLLACGSTQGYCQARTVTDFVGSTDTATVDTWTVTPSGTITYYLFGTAPSTGGSGLDAAGVRSAIGLASANLDTQLSGIQSDTDNIQTRLPTSLVSGRIDASVGAYQTGLTPLQPTVSGRTLDVSAGGEAGIDWANVGSPTTSVTLSGTTVGTATAVGTVNALANNSLTAAAAAADLGTELATANWANGTRTLTASSDPTAAAIADAVWDEARAGHTTSGTFGFYLDSAISGVSTGGVSAGEIADAVWDEALSGHATAGTTGAALSAASSGGSGGLDAAGVRAAIGLATANLDVQLSGIQSDADNIQTRLPAALVSGRMDSSVGAMANNTMTAAAAAADLTTELQAGLATSAGQTAISDAIAALNNMSAEELRDLVIEDQGGGVSLGCALSVILAYASGDLSTTGSSSTYRDPSGTETRSSGTVTSNGNRAASITCPTY